MEDLTTEWKESWRDDCLKTICAFANTQGGVVEVGRADNGEVVGVTNPLTLLTDIPNTIRHKLGVIAEVTQFIEGGKNLVRISVQKYSNPISYHGKFYVRTGSTTQELSGTALAVFLLKVQGKTWDELTEPAATLKDLSSEALRKFRELAVSGKRLTEKDVSDAISDEQLLENLGLVINGQLTKAAILLFGNNPEKFFFGCHVRIGLFSSKEELFHHDEVRGPLMLVADKVIEILYLKYFKGLVDFKGLQRIENFPLAKEALREAVLNAITHRDYSVKNSIQIKIYEDRLIIFNDGCLPADWTVETLQKAHKSLPRNPLVANTFFRSAHIETWGRGIQRMNEICDSYDAPRPTFEAIGHSFATILKFTDVYMKLARKYGTVNDPVNEGVNEGVTEGVNEGVKLSTVDTAILNALKQNSYTTAEKLISIVNKSKPTVERSLQKLKANGYIKRLGSDKTGSWEILRSVDS